MDRKDEILQPEDTSFCISKSDELSKSVVEPISVLKETKSVVLDMNLNHSEQEIDAEIDAEIIDNRKGFCLRGYDIAPCDIESVDAMGTDELQGVTVITSNRHTDQGASCSAQSNLENSDRRNENTAYSLVVSETSNKCVSSVSGGHVSDLLHRSENFYTVDLSNSSGYTINSNVSRENNVRNNNSTTSEVPLQGESTTSNNFVNPSSSEPSSVTISNSTTQTPSRSHSQHIEHLEIVLSPSTVGDNSTRISVHAGYQPTIGSTVFSFFMTILFVGILWIVVFMIFGSKGHAIAGVFLGLFLVGFLLNTCFLKFYFRLRLFLGIQSIASREQAAARRRQEEEDTRRRKAFEPPPSYSSVVEAPPSYSYALTKSQKNSSSQCCPSPPPPVEGSLCSLCNSKESNSSQMCSLCQSKQTSAD